MGFDPLGFLEEWQAHRVNNFLEYLQKMTPAVTLRIATHRTPDYVRRYPSLLTQPLPLGPVSGWEIRANWTGIPFAWTPLNSLATAGWSENEVRIVEVDSAMVHRERSKSVAVLRRGGWTPGKDLTELLQQLFSIP